MKQPALIASEHPVASSSLENLWWRVVVGARYFGARFAGQSHYARTCNVCGYQGMFGPAGGGLRMDAKCPRCNSAERHRLFKLWLDRNADTLRDADVLHFAPEKSLAKLIRPLARTYRTADIAPGRADLVLNIEQIDLPANSVDGIVCFHVLEHVNDAKALAELYRVLRPGGACLIMTPVVEGWVHTYENSGISSPEDRTLHFGQHDHVRYYGADIRARIGAAGFSLSEFTAEGPDIVRYALLPGEKVFVATKPA
jgi:SAM-dependent methyltransferase